MAKEHRDWECENKYFGLKHVQEGNNHKQSNGVCLKILFSGAPVQEMSN